MRASKAVYLPALWGAIAMLCATPAKEMEFSFRPVTISETSKPVKALIASGEIRHGDTKRLREFLGIRGNVDTFLLSPQAGGAGTIIILDSPGGDVDEAILLSQVMRDILAMVGSQSPMSCASACFFLYVGAARRMTSTDRLAVHRPFFSGDATRKMSLVQAEAAHNAGFSRAKRWMQDQLVPQTLIDRMFSLSSTQAYWLTPQDVEQLGQRAPWYEEWLLARCPNYISAYQRFSATFGTAANAEASREVGVQARCEFNATDAERTTVLLRYVKELERAR